MWYLVDLPRGSQVELFKALFEKFKRTLPAPVEMADGSLVFEVELSPQELTLLNAELPVAKVYPSSKLTSW